MTCSLLPAVELGGWTGSPSAWKNYFPDWRVSKNLTLALIDLFSSKSKASYNSTRKDIIDTFYGGEKRFQSSKNEMVLDMPSIFIQ